MADRLLTVKDLAERWQCGRTHIYDMMLRREIPWVRIGDKRRFREEDIAEWERQNRNAYSRTTADTADSSGRRRKAGA
jgi:excisionase family DNA binding protein